VEDPAALVAYLMEESAEVNPDSVSALIAGGETLRIGLARSVPVQTEYYTAWVDSEGRAQFREDVYGYDAVLAAVLEGEPLRADGLPGTDRPRVQVDEATSGIVPDAAGAQAEGGSVQVGVGDVGQADVDRPAGEVEALSRRLVSRLAEILVGPGRPVTGNDLEWFSGLQALRQSVELFEQAGIDGVDLAGPVVAQDTREVRQAVGEVFSAGPVGAAEALAGVDVAEGKNALGPGTGQGGLPETRGP
jgi:hypothetical protein